MSSGGMIHISVKAIGATLFQQRLMLWAGGLNGIPYFLRALLAKHAFQRILHCK